MRLVQITLLCTVSICLSACGGPESSAQKSVKKSLKDPDSAKFGEFTEFGTDTACLAVNAKNAMGGYTGEQQALLLKTKEGWEVMNISKVAHAECIAFANRDDMKELIEKWRQASK